MLGYLPLCAGLLLALPVADSLAPHGTALDEAKVLYHAEKAPALVKIIVPPGATVEFDGFKTNQTGTVRYFVTPELEVGHNYGYKIKVTYNLQGANKTLERTVKIKPGEEVVEDFTKAETPKKEEPKKETPKKETPKKEEPKKETPKKEVHLDVVYVPTPQKVVDGMLKLAQVTEKDVVYDLGCGDGRIVVTAVKKFKAKHGLGVELYPERVRMSRENAKKEGVADKIEIREGSIFDVKDASGASVVTLYLLPELNLKLMPMLKKTLKPGSRIVSHDFDMGDWKADKVESIRDDNGREHTIYLWTIPGAKKTENKKEPKKDQPTIRVPYVPTPQKVVDAMLNLAKIQAGDVVYDLGCGDGRIVVTAVKKYKAKRGWGLDLNPERLKECAANAKKEGVTDKVKFEQGDVLKVETVADANVVTLYLLPEVNRRLAPMLKKTLKPGSRIVSHDFDMGDWKPDQKIELEDDDGFGHTIYLWTIPGNKK